MKWSHYYAQKLGDWMDDPNVPDLVAFGRACLVFGTALVVVFGFVFLVVAWLSG